MKVKSSCVLEQSMLRIVNGEQSFVCAAIQDVETDLRFSNNGKDVRTNASKLFQQYKPKEILEEMRATQPWWPKGSPERITALEQCIALAKKRGD